MTRDDKLRRAEAAVIKAAEKWYDSNYDLLERKNCKCNSCVLIRSVIRLRKARGE